MRLLLMEPRCSACRPQRSTTALRSIRHLNLASRTLPRSGFVLPPNPVIVGKREQPAPIASTAR